MEYKETIINVQTGEITERPYTAEEIAEIKKQNSINQAKLAAIQAEEEARAQAKAALLAQLGITEEQAKLLLS